MTTPSSLMELIKQKKQEIDVGNRAKTVTLPPKTSRWRILPGWSKDKADFSHDFGLHYIKDTSGKTRAVYVCVDRTYGKPCSICAAIDTAINNTDDPEMKELLGKAKASKRILLNALHLDGPNPTTPVILEVPKTVFDQIIRISEEWECRTISVESDAVDLSITKEGTGLTTKYSIQPSPKSTKVDSSVMDKVADLDQYVAQESTEAANRALTSISTIAGLLPPSVGAPASRPSLPKVAELREISAEDMEVIEEQALEELEDGVEPTPTVMPAKTVKSTSAAKTATASVSTGDSELDEMMAQLLV